MAHLGNYDTVLAATKQGEENGDAKKIVRATGRKIR